MKTLFVSAMNQAAALLKYRSAWLMFLFLLSTLAPARPDEWYKQLEAESLSAWNFFGTEDDDHPLAGEHQQANALACMPYLNVSLGQQGFALLTAITLVNAPEYPPHMYIVDIMGPLTNTVYCEQIGQTLQVMVTEIMTNNSCMSTIYVEDKMKPGLTCTSDTIACNVNINDLAFETYLDEVYDNCDDDPNLWYSYVIQNLPCNPDNFTQQIIVTWTATDNSGNSSTCTDILYLRKPAPGQIVFPSNITLNCVNANIDPSNTGEPTYNDLPIGYTCQYIVFYTDQVVPMCNGSQKILRLWTVKDWCTSVQVTHVQEIMITDNTPPVLTCPPNTTINAGAGGCTANYTLPVPAVTDACANPQLITIVYTIYGVPGFFTPGQVVNLGLGTRLITIKATDPCGNSSQCQYTVTVRDNTPPIPVCDALIVGLGPDGTATLYADLLDFPVIEACGILSKEIWRMTNTCNQPADLVPGPDVLFCCADIGTTVMVSFKVTDLSGNMNTCMFNVTVVDQLPPAVECRNITVSVGGGGSIVITPGQVEASATDNCQIISHTVTPNTFDCSDIGTHVVVLTVTDQSGNTATCSANVTIVDEVPPEAECRDITVTLNTQGEVTITASQIDNGSTDNCGIDTMFLNQYHFDCDDMGANTVILTVIDFGGNADICTATVTVLTLPPVAECRNITVSLDENGEVTITPGQVDDGSTDDCGIVSYEVTPSTFDCDDTGGNTVVLTVTDNSGNTATCSAVVTVIDDMPPFAECRDITIMLDANGQASITAGQVDDGSSDNCGDVSISVTPSTFDCDDVGNNVVVLTVTDGSGNTSTCTANVYVLMPDPPVALCQDITVTLNPVTGTVTIDPASLNNGSSTQCGDLTFSADPDFFSCDDLGPNVVILTVTDETGASSTCTATVTVLENPPVAICQDITVGLNANGEVTISALQVDDDSEDDCEIISYEVVPDAFDCDDLGDNVVVLTVTDQSGLTSTCTAVVTVVDNIPPVANCQNVTVTLDGNGNASVDADDINNNSTDNCTIISLEVEPNQFNCDDIGPNVVVLTVTDQSGNTSTCTAIVTVEADPPQAECQDITISVGPGPGGTVTIEPGDVNAGSGSNCGDLILTLDDDTFDCDDLGDNIVVLTVTDQNGNSSTCSAVVTVIDDVAPECSASDLTVFVDNNGAATITAAGIDDGSTDNCGPVTLSVTPSDFDCDDLGDNVVVLTVTDAAGNTSTCTATVTVVDTISPVCVTEDITVSINGNGTVTIMPGQVDGGSTDNCGDVFLSVSPNTFDCDDIGTHVVVLTVTDGSGNSSTCTASVTIEDSGGLEAFCQNITIFLDANGNASVTPEQINNGSGGGCQPGMLQFNLSQTNFSCPNVGNNIVTLTVTDQQGNTATCTAIVTVVDNLPPAITCPANVTVDCHTVTNPENTSQFGNATATDNCPGAIVTETHVININNCGVGSILRTFTATDASGNTATCTQLVTISNPDPFDESDITWPPSPVSVNICNSTHPNNIPNGTPVLNPTALLCADVSVSWVDQVQQNVDNNPATPCQIITRTWTVVDNCQQNASFVFVQTINVQDMAPPLFVNINDMTKVAGPNCTAQFTLIASATDCAGVSITNNSPYGATNGANASGNYPLGQTVVIFTATDGCGNISTMDVVITVTDPDPAQFQCNKVIFFLPPELEIIIDAGAFVDVLAGTCSNEDDFLISYSHTNPFLNLKSFGCGDVGVSTFSLYFWNSTGTVLVDSCTTADLDLRDPNDFCLDGLVVGGTVEADGGEPVIGVEIAVTNASMLPGTTDDDGRYLIEGFQEATAYEITPFHDKNHKTGVSTLDLVAIQRHLLGMAQLGSPYKLIAADANRSGTVTAADIVEIRKLILGIYDRFPQNTSWRFVSREYVFPDPENPVAPAGFPESIWLDSVLTTGSVVHFRGIKTGDVNGSYKAKFRDDPPVRPRSNGIYELVARQSSMGDPDGKWLDIMIKPGQQPVDGMQMSLWTGPLSEAQVQLIRSAVLTDEEWHYEVGAQTLNISWSAATAHDHSGSILLSVPDAGYGLPDIRIADGPVAPEVYRTEGGETYTDGIRLSRETSEVSGNYHLYQNIPNPFSETTLIRFALPVEETVRLSIYDMAGRQVFTREARMGAGVHEMEIRNRDLGAPGMYYYTLYTPEASFTRKLSFTGH